MKKLFALALTTIALAACGQTGADEPAVTESTDTPEAPIEETAFNYDLEAIAVIMREEGSGSRGVFEEILGVNQEDDASDAVTDLAIIGQGNGGVATAVDTTEAAIGYVSFATLEQGLGIFGVAIDGVEPTHENVLSGDFPMARPFVLIHGAELSEIAEAFLTFVGSVEGAEALTDAGTIPNTAGRDAFDASEFAHLQGTLVMGGSTSVERAANELGQLFMALVPGVSVTFNSSGSGAGINGAQEGTYEIGFSSRALRDGELQDGNGSFVMTMDGLAIVTNAANPVTNLTLDQLRAIYLGEITSWQELN